MKKVDGKYRLKSTENTICVGTTYPYFNAVSLIMIINRVYPRLGKFLTQKKLQGGPGVIEIYRMNIAKPHVQILVPLENHNDFLFE